MGFEPTVPLVTGHTISSRAPSASSVISPTKFVEFRILNIKLQNENIKNFIKKSAGHAPYSTLAIENLHFSIFNESSARCLAERVGFEPIHLLGVHTIPNHVICVLAILKIPTPILLSKLPGSSASFHSFSSFERRYADHYLTVSQVPPQPFELPELSGLSTSPTPPITPLEYR